MKKLFYARDFQPTEWDSAEEKAEFANTFVRFVESNFNRQFFTGKFYQRIVCMFGFHAFPDSQNFWKHYFDSEDGRRRFILSCVEHQHAGGAATTYADVHARLQDWLLARFPTLITDDQPHEASAASTKGTGMIAFNDSPSAADTLSGEVANTHRETSGNHQRSFMW